MQVDVNLVELSHPPHKPDLPASTSAEQTTCCGDMPPETPNAREDIWPFFVNDKEWTSSLYNGKIHLLEKIVHYSDSKIPLNIADKKIPKAHDTTQKKTLNKAGHKQEKLKVPGK